MRPDSRAKRRSLLLAIFLLLVLGGALGSASGVAEGRLVDTDAYSWVNRVTDLRNDGDWFDDTIERVNPPVGHKQHWSRPFDALLLVGGLVGEPLVGFTDALFAWAVVVPCLLGAATLWALWWGLSDLLDAAGLEALALLAGLQLYIVRGFMAGRSDHQALIGLLLVVVLGVSRRAFAAEGDIRWVVAAGVLSGVGLWVGLEFALVLVTVMAAVVLEWLFRHNDGMGRLMVYAMSLAAAIVIGLLLENGIRGFATTEPDEMSIVFVVFAGLAGVASAVIAVNSDRLEARAKRATALAIAAAICAGILIAVFPELVRGPLGDVDPLYEQTRLRSIAEIQPAIGASARHTLRTALPGFNLLPFAAATVIWMWRERRSAFDQQIHLLLVPAAVYLALALVQNRWLFALNLVLVVPAARSVQRLMYAAAPRATRVHLGMVAVAAVVALWWVPVLAIVRHQPQPRCHLDDAITVLNEPSALGGGVLRLMAFTDYGPELLFRTPHSVLSIPNHRHQPGYTATFTAMNARPSVARGILARHAVEAVLVCTDDVEASFYDTNPEAFHARLVRGDAPAWLIEVPMPATEPRFRLYQVESAR